jgi:hypothetical protein
MATGAVVLPARVFAALFLFAAATPHLKIPGKEKPAAISIAAGSKFRTQNAGP